jgi:hypothetical protein
VVDVEHRRLVRDLRSDHVLLGTIAGGTAYLLAGDIAEAQALEAYDIESGARRWSTPVLDSFGKAHAVGPTLDCGALAASQAGVLCATRQGVTLYSAIDGAPRVVHESDRIDDLALLGRHVALLQRGGSTCGSMGCFETSYVDWLEAGGAPAPGASHVALALRPESAHIPGALDSFTAIGRELCAVATTTHPVSGPRRTDMVHAVCFDESGKSRVAIHEQVEGARLEVIDRGPRFSVISNQGQGPRSLLLDLEKGTLARSDEAIACALTNAHGEIDMLVAPPRVIDPSGGRVFELPTDLLPRLRALRAGTKIVVASFRPTATGSKLVALDAKTGSVAWTGDVELLPTTRGDWNNVGLAIDGDAVVLRGSEPSQRYLEIFALDDGKRLLSVVRPR